MVGNSFGLPISWTKIVRCCPGIILGESIDQKGLQFDSGSSDTIILDNQAGDCYNIITNGENQRQLINSLASGGQNCHEICHGWICDIWCPNGRGFILNHNNRNPLGGSQEIHRYIQGRQLVWNFQGISLAWCCQLAISHNMLKILSLVVEDLL